MDVQRWKDLQGIGMAHCHMQQFNLVVIAVPGCVVLQHEIQDLLLIECFLYKRYADLNWIRAHVKEDGVLFSISHLGVICWILLNLPELSAPLFTVVLIFTLALWLVNDRWWCPLLGLGDLENYTLFKICYNWKNVAAVNGRELAVKMDRSPGSSCFLKGHQLFLYKL